MNVIDLIAIAPTYIEAGLATREMPSLTIVRVIRLTRVFRVFKISRYSSGLKLMGESLKRSLNILSILMFFLAIGVTLSSCAMFYVEKGVYDEDLQMYIQTDWYGNVIKSPFQSILGTM